MAELLQLQDFQYGSFDVEIKVSEPDLSTATSEVWLRWWTSVSNLLNIRIVLVKKLQQTNQPTNKLVWLQYLLTALNGSSQCVHSLFYSVVKTVQAFVLQMKL